MTCTDPYPYVVRDASGHIKMRCGLKERAQSRAAELGGTYTYEPRHQ